jgi:DNA-binding XRE family transcriptional regulator
VTWQGVAWTGREGQIWLGLVRQGAVRQQEAGLMGHEQLKDLRNKLGLSVAQAAGQVHVSARSWSRYEDGTRSIPDAIIHLFCIQNNVDWPPTLR